MAILTKKAIKQANDNPSELVSIPEWGGDVYVRALTAFERDNLEERLFKQSEGKEPNNVRSIIAAMCCVDENGNRLFEDSDIEWLSKKNASAVSRVSDKARILSKMTKQEVEELEKNSEGDRANSSNSDSVSN